MSTRRLIAGFSVLMAALSVAYFTIPWPFIWTGIGLSSATAVAVGAVRHRPRRRTPWLLVSAGLFAFVLADTTYYFLTEVLGQEAPFPSLADAIYLGVYSPLVAAGFIGLARSGAANRDRASLLDALAMTLGVGLLSWLFLIDPYVRAEDLTLVQKGISIAYPLFDVLLLLILTRLVIEAGLTPSAFLLIAGTVFTLVSDVIYGLTQLNGGWIIGRPIDVGWILWYAAWGLASLHPSMVKLTEPRSVRQPGLRVGRLVLLALSTLIAPAVVLIEVTRGSLRDVGVATAVSIAMLVVVLSRLYGAINVYREGVGRERGLREASTTLVSATDSLEVITAVRAAVANLLPPGTDHRVVLALEDTLRGVAVPLSHPREGAPPPSRSPEEIPLSHPRNGDQRTDGQAADVPDPAVTAPDRRTRLVYTRSLDGPVAAQLDGLEVALQCRMLISHRPSGGPHVGTLYVAAAEPILVDLQESLEVLASQAALALERIALSSEISRRNSEEYFRTLVHNTADVILILNHDDRIRYASPSAELVFGPIPLVGTRLHNLILPEYRSIAARLLERVRAGEHRTAGDDWVVLGAHGERVQVDASCRDLRDEPTVDGLVVTLRDVTERRRLERELRYRAYHDSLTGLANRALFQDKVSKALQHSRRGDTTVGILFIDLDDFKVVNDTMGHTVGDELLVAVSERLTSALRGSDTAARLGGDEFAALIEDARDPADVEEVATRVVKAFAEPFLLNDSLVNGMVSIGIATTPEADNFDDLLRQADLALYVAKGAGKGQWRRYQSTLHHAVLQRLELRAELDQAIANRSLRLEYQPIVALDSGKPAGLEALVRWNHPTRGLLAPDQFIDVAEESGLVVPMGTWILERALADAAGWCEVLPVEDPPYVSVNVSVRQFRDPTFLDTVRRQLAASGLRPDRLVLEITESLLLRDDEQVRADLTSLRDLGVRVAIDDFGTGYSSLSYLRQVPADILKIERSFIDTVAVVPKQRALVEGILRLAHTLGLIVVAEGIESEVDRDVLGAIGCGFGQGYLFCRPLSYGDAIEWLTDTQRVVA